MFTEIERFESTDLTPLDFCFVGFDEEQCLKTKVVTPDEFARSHFGSAAHIKKREDQFRRTARDLRALIAQCIEKFSNFYCEL
jgi:hypothetical protein